MKNIKLVVTAIIIIIISLVIYIFIKKEDDKIVKNENFIFIEDSDDFFNEDKKTNDYIFNNYEDFYDNFKSDKLKKEDFNDYNYLLINIDYNPCSEKNITPTDYNINGDNIDITVKFESVCGGCGPRRLYYLLKLDKNINFLKTNLNYKSVKKEFCNPNLSYKPLIYLYPEKEMNIKVKVGKPELLTTTYPKYENEWDIIAKPNGDIIDKKGRTYYGLYWEGLNNIEKTFNEGFVVNKEDTISFLEEKLSILGLTEKEANEFIIYWLPKLAENNYNLIRFESIGKINNEMPLDINPKPETLIRVFMVYKPIDKIIEIKEQVLDSPIRTGFTVVEWGGTLVSD